MEIGWRPIRDNDWVIVPDNTTRFQAIANHFSLFFIQRATKKPEGEGRSPLPRGQSPWVTADFTYFAAFAQVARRCSIQWAIISWNRLRYHGIARHVT